MDMYEFSIKMEHDAESLYRSLAGKSSHTGIKKVFNMLADDEARHARAVENLQKRNPLEKNKSSMAEVKTVFSRIKDASEAPSEEILIELRRALEIEKKVRDFYKEKFSELDTDEGQELFQKLSRQEDYHYNTVSNLIELIEKPQWWVEHAEFTPQGDDYY
ncbi:MAG: ferritin family protein [Spirochaetales bacterium]|nr:ferritin family protein [Spirochaetales bacterium]